LPNLSKNNISVFFSILCKKLPPFILAGFDLTTLGSNLLSVAGGDNTTRPSRHGWFWRYFSVGSKIRSKNWPLARVARFFLVQTYQIGKNITNDHKLYQTAINYTKWRYNIPKGHKIYQHLPFKGSPKFTQIWDFWFENKPSGNLAVDV
jgi:hypothetical protein